MSVIIKNFEYLLSLATEAHFGRAADKCHVSQSTLSSGIKQLEEDLDIQIVRRGRRYEGLTPEGEAVLSWAKKMHQDCSGMKRELSARKKGLEGEFRVGVATSVSAVAPVLSMAISEKTPRVRQSVIVDDQSVIQSLIDTHQIDVGLLHIDALSPENYDTHLLYREGIFLFQVHQNPVARRVQWADLADLPLCLMKSALPEKAQKQLERHSGPVVTTNSLDVVAGHLKTQASAAILPQSCASRLADIPDLRVSAIDGVDAQSSVGFASIKGGLRSPLAAALQEIVHMPEVADTLECNVIMYRRFQAKKIEGTI
ncbi:LysR family transcriptional regulator [Kozakia baliensis]|uniref:LysR family transcriptional regulator n=1 Tax=Kozakia baliensis TaxID=153496 RepID=UPI00116CEEB4|nr:LysR family transcriptional regulator [Kozakia baliensis]GBR26930.1 LysR family transcriptional regulator [Kozakia baliensis NRIC 0488]GEL65718.1 LysR family transcriptional regulator [Kozakia baliensis]